ncbi:hypothetical protein HAX54_011304 [Datura stramonium]|uniref:Uncharacterized protein n=1 Tax=Datura stramonium TaxID=4076 RepID=A0ABS8TJL0_DATST|nr:hypothetical protein [Datura stramonium]
MVAHPETEWIWWVDSDVVPPTWTSNFLTDRYKAHNFVVHGWEKLIYEQQSWTSINAGVFLIRNCQWSMDLMEAWAKMGPQSPEYDKWGEILRTTFKDIPGYWVEIVGTLDNITDKYLGIEKGEARLRRRHGERVSESYAKKALNFADNQVLRKYGYMHKDLLDSSTVFPVPFDFPA